MLDANYKATMIFPNGAKQEIPFQAPSWMHAMEIVGKLAQNEIINNRRVPISVAADKI